MGGMDSAFWIKLALGFLFGGTWVTLSTVASERLGSKIGGLIGGLPSTVVLALLFIGLTQTPPAAAEAAIIIPLSMSCTGLFMVVFLSLAKRGLGVGLGIAFLVWLILSASLVAFPVRNAWVSIIVWVILTVGYLLIVEKVMHIRSHSTVEVHYNPAHILYRALFGGTVVSCAVLAGKLAGPLVGGVLSTFPAMFTSNLTITYRSGGAEFARAVGKSLLASGMITVPSYALAVSFLYPRVGLATGTILALLFSLVIAYVVYRFVRAKMT